MCNVVLSIGSNYQQQVYFPQAFALLTDAFGELLFSPVYESVPVTSFEGESECGSEFESDGEKPLYYNLVVGFNSEKSIAEIQVMIHRIEDECGRDRSQTRVTVDIDLLLYGNEVGEVDGVTLPRKDILAYAYVLRPLSDLFPERLHPEVKRSFQCLWQTFCEKSKQISRLKPVDFVWRDQVISIAPSCLII